MNRKLRTQIALLAGLTLFTAIMLTPIAWGFLTSIKEPVDAFVVPPKLFFEPTWKFHYAIWTERGFDRFFLNTAIISVGVVLISVTIGTMAAYGLSRMRGRGTQGLLFGLLAMRMLPHVLLAIPFFVLATYFDLIDTYFGLIIALVAINQPFTIWLMRSFFVDVPHELYEAAELDGCTQWQAFARVALPMVRPGIWVTALFSLMLSYNEFLLSLVLTGTRTKTLPVAIAEYSGEDLTYWSLSAAAAIGIMLPIVLFLMVVQRHLVRGLSFGAVKG